ncbi:MAG: hypothetical protein MZU79_03660 [Anaerotruncus sp.]|nr:hypothetical protein [Anaerotruncus sp.]
MGIPAFADSQKLKMKLSNRIKERKTMKKNKSPKVVKKEIGAFADKPIALPEGIDMENHVIATYWIQAG